MFSFFIFLLLPSFSQAALLQEITFDQFEQIKNKNGEYICQIDGQLTKTTQLQDCDKVSIDVFNKVIQVANNKEVNKNLETSLKK